jgi:hypothetical protein
VSIFIPVWILYLLGGVIGLCVIGLACLGILFVISMSKWSYRG